MIDRFDKFNFEDDAKPKNFFSRRRKSKSNSMKTTFFFVLSAAFGYLIIQTRTTSSFIIRARSTVTDNMYKTLLCEIRFIKLIFSSLRTTLLFIINSSKFCNINGTSSNVVCFNVIINSEC